MSDDEGPGMCPRCGFSLYHYSGKTCTVSGEPHPVWQRPPPPSFREAQESAAANDAADAAAEDRKETEGVASGAGSGSGSGGSGSGSASASASASSSASAGDDAGWYHSDGEDGDVTGYVEGTGVEMNVSVEGKDMELSMISGIGSDNEMLGRCVRHAIAMARRSSCTRLFIDEADPREVLIDAGGGGGSGGDGDSGEGAAAAASDGAFGADWPTRFGFALDDTRRQWSYLMDG